MCNKALGNYVHALKFVPDQYKTQEMCNKTVDAHHATMKYVSD